MIRKDEDRVRILNGQSQASLWKDVIKSTGKNDRKKRPEKTDRKKRPEKTDRKKRPEKTDRKKRPEKTTGKNDRKKPTGKNRPEKTTGKNDRKIYKSNGDFLYSTYWFNIVTNVYSGIN